MEQRNKIIECYFTLTREDNKNRIKQKIEENPLMKNENKATKKNKYLFKTGTEKDKNSNENLAPTISKKLFKTITKIDKNSSNNSDAKKFNIFKTDSIIQHNNKICFNNSEEKYDDNDKNNQPIKNNEEELEKYHYQIGKSDAKKNEALNCYKFDEKKILHEEVQCIIKMI